MSNLKGKKAFTDMAPAPDPAPPPYNNREASWLRFNERVLEEAANPDNPLLERLKFLAIFESNLDEFYMVRVSGLIEQVEGGVVELSPDGLTPAEQIRLIQNAAHPLRQRAAQLLESTLRPALAKAGIQILDYADLTEKQAADMRDRFRMEIFPVCTPLLLHPAPTMPFISSRSLNLAVELGNGAEFRLARVKVPTILPRFLKVSKKQEIYVPLESVIAANLQYLFPGVEVRGAHFFRVIRDADIAIRELEAADLVASIEETIRLRRFGDPVLLVVSKDMPKRIQQLLTKLLELQSVDVMAVEGMLGLEGLWELAGLDRPGLRYRPFTPHLGEALAAAPTLFQTIAAGDVLLHHPFDSFRPVEAFVASAAQDPNVIGIKQTLYRVGERSPIVESLLDAANRGKQVAVMVELKARFDEGNNLVWARALERAGVHVSYGFPELKTHCKLCMVVRREPGGIRSYAHIGTGNYNPETARLYTDLGLFTCDPDATKDILELFNFLTGFSKQTVYRKLLVAPINLREAILDRIEREIRSHVKSRRGRLIFKLNSLVDPEIIDALYAASRAGVEIDLIVRGICCLRPGVPGLSERIRVVSIVGRFLEHSRVFYFGNGRAPEALIGSADLMRRNLDRRIEVLIPVENPELVRHLRDDLLEPYLADTVKAWALMPDGTYVRRHPDKSKKGFDAQLAFLDSPSGGRRFVAAG